MLPPYFLRKTGLFLAIITYYLGGYFCINEWAFYRGKFYTVALPWDAQIPFLPWSIAGYNMIFPLLASGYLFIANFHRFQTLVKAFFVTVTFHFLIFLIFPVQYVLRPTLPLQKGAWLILVDFYYWVDKPFNCFPSLHVSNSWLVCFYLSKEHPKLKYLFYGLATIVSISVLVVKQHYILDVVFGFLVAWLVASIPLTKLAFFSSKNKSVPANAQQKPVGA